jgi:hypothetical protein
MHAARLVVAVLCMVPVVEWTSETGFVAWISPWLWLRPQAQPQRGTVCYPVASTRGSFVILRGDSLGVSLEKAESNTRSVVSSEPHQDCTGSVVHNSLPQTFGSFAQWRMAQTDKGMCRSMPNPNMTVA